MGSSGVDAGHLVVAAALTYLLGFERDLRGAPTGDRVFALVGAGSGVIGIIATHGAPFVLAGEGRLMAALVATALALFVPEVRHIKILSVLDGRRWHNYFGNDDDAPIHVPSASDDPPSDQ